MIQLRDYQEQLIQESRLAFKAGHRRVLVQSPTGSGKTVIFAKIAEGLFSKGKSAVILLHRQELVQQTSETFAEIGIPHGIISPEYRPSPGMSIQIAAIQTLAKRNYLPPCDLLIPDEAHHSVSPTWSRVLSGHSGKILGFTATPERLDGKGLGGEFDHMILGPEVRDLIDAGWLSDYDAVSHPADVDKLKQVRTIAGDYDTKQLAQIMSGDVIVGDAVRHYAKHLFPRSAILFSPTVWHAELMAETFRSHGYRAACIHGKLPKGERKGIVQALATMQLDVLTSCDLISEGFDVPEVGGVICMRNTKSLPLHLQQLGRALRPKRDRKPAMLIDHVGNLRDPKLGLPDMPRPWSLEGAKARLAAESAPAKSAGNGSLPIAARLPYAVIDGELVPMARGSKDWMLAHGNFHAAVRACETREDFERMAKLRGFKPGFARAQWCHRLAVNEKDPARQRILTRPYRVALELCESKELLAFMAHTWGYTQDWYHMQRRAKGFA